MQQPQLKISSNRRKTERIEGVTRSHILICTAKSRPVGISILPHHSSEEQKLLRFNTLSLQLIIASPMFFGTLKTIFFNLVLFPASLLSPYIYIYIANERSIYKIHDERTLLTINVLRLGNSLLYLRITLRFVQLFQVGNRISLVIRLRTLSYPLYGLNFRGRRHVLLNRNVSRRRSIL